MESFEHDEFIRALGMEGKSPYIGDDEKAMQRWAEEREAKVEAVRLKREAARRGSGPVKEAEGDEEFTHEMYAEAMKMQGTALAVTAETLEALEAKRKAELERLAEVKYKKAGDKSLAQQWQEDRDRETEEIEQEALLRKQAKEAAAAARAAAPPPEPTPESPVRPTVDASAFERVNSSVPNRLFEGVGHSDVRNHVLAVKISDESLLGELREAGFAVTSAADLAEAKDVVASHLSQGSPQGITLTVVVHTSPEDADGTALSEFIEYAQKELFPTPAAPQPPPVLLHAKPEGEQVLPAEFLAYLKGQVRPPYVVCSVCDDTVKKFIINNKVDTSLEEEVETLNALVSTQLQGPTSPGLGGTVGGVPTKGVIATGKDIDLALSNAQAVQWLEVAMNWRGRMDLDLSCILLNKEGGRAGMVYFANVASHKSSGFNHSGDIQTAPNGDKECINVALPLVPPAVHCLYYVINSFSGEPFSDVEAIDAAVTLSDDEAGNGLRENLTQFPLTGSGVHRAVVLCRVFRTGKTSWGITKVDITHDKAATCRELVSTVKKHFLEQPPLVWEEMGS
eukprot:TRINITY_DN8761_c0_g1_i1.p1 TRINITY_DN8761_c0_g1~~TRINITY_DN8761_c0_g1_i1.p1  ORF type:complete len:566 (+),score=172.57 TRINITY_DN8761_c0_g1_i1:69-1766(+)